MIAIAISDIPGRLHHGAASGPTRSAYRNRTAGSGGAGSRFTTGIGDIVSGSLSSLARCTCSYLSLK